jgi:hypothetical protein
VGREQSSPTDAITLALFVDAEIRAAINRTGVGGECELGPRRSAAARRGADDEDLHSSSKPVKRAALPRGLLVRLGITDVIDLRGEHVGPRVHASLTDTILRVPQSRPQDRYNFYGSGPSATERDETPLTPASASSATAVR